MGILSRFNRKLKAQNSQRSKEFEEFKEEMTKLMARYGFRLRPIITKYGAEIEFTDMGKPEIKGVQIKDKEK